jgi:hypothetical protein
MATFGAARLSALAQRVEEAEAGDNALLQQIDEEYDRARAVVVSLLTARPSS